MRKVKICAFLCALAIVLSTTGCSDTTWAIKYNDIKIPTGVYLYYLLSNADTVEQYAASTSSSSGSSSSAALASSNSSSSKSTDAWSQKIAGQSAVSWAMNESVKSCKVLLEIEKECKDKKITLSASDAKTAKSNADSAYTNYATVFKENGISQESIERIVNDMTLRQKLFDSYYGKGGTKAVSENDLSDYYVKNFAHVKQIFVSKNDLTTNQPLTGDKLTAAKNKADEAFKAASADKSNFDKYVSQYNEDPGMKQNPDGYIFSKSTASSSNYDTKFTDLAFSLKVGDVGEAESDMGWFIEYRVATDPKASTFSTYRDTVLSEMKGDEFENMLEASAGKLQIEQNSSALNNYNPKNIKLQ